ncbi:unnamed protein product [Adineta steineri]|uniref:HAT C-terminal dimerisation domain-containing protein n=1 Tax=Adineta steineri TaxID=433720 RepID=A0A815PI97_9BILA|nr:unnamed protein product [Adineta steineri]CAF4095126.1 unnamed protein product [Adineta steineri]
MSNTCWDMIDLLIKTLEPFQNATNLISGNQYSTIGLGLFVMRKIRQDFLRHIRPDDSEVLQKLKQLIDEKLIFYTTDKYGEEFMNLIIHAYFDPYGLSVLTQKEIVSTERLLKSLTRHIFCDHQPTNISEKQKSTALDKFLDSINGDVDEMPQVTSNTSTSSFTNEAKKYRQLAASFMADKRTDKCAAVFWNCYHHSLPNFSMLARKYLAAPATSVPSESAFSKSAYYGRKERATIHPDRLSQSVFLKDKLITKK